MAADQGDTILLAAGIYIEGELDITKDFVTILGPKSQVPTTARGSCVGGEACVTGTGKTYVFGIGADHVSIDGLTLLGDAATTWTVVQVLPGDHDKWTIEYNFIALAGQKKPGSSSNHSFGIYGDPQTTSGTITYTGNEIGFNRIWVLGGQTLLGANKTAGMGIYLEGIEGLSAQCAETTKFECGVWIHNNIFEDLAVGQNENNFDVDVNGKEPSVAISLLQDPSKGTPNRGGRVNLNSFDWDSAESKNLDIGIVVSTGDTILGDEPGLNPLSFHEMFEIGHTDAFVANIGGKATVDELSLAPFYRSLKPNVLEAGSDVYFRTEALAKDNSASDAMIVNLFISRPVFALPAVYTMTVNPQGIGVVYEISKVTECDYPGCLGKTQVRAGGRVLYNEQLWAENQPGTTVLYFGLSDLILNGTKGDDLLIVDFDNGNPLPSKGIKGAGPLTPGEPATKFNTDPADDGGFDTITLRGDHQFDFETILMTDSDGGKIMFEPTLVGAPLQNFGSLTADILWTTTSIEFDYLEPINDLVIVNDGFAIHAPDNVDTEINVINGPFVLGYETFQVSSGAVKTFEEVNFANKKFVHVYGSDDVGATGKGNDVITLFTDDGDAPKLLSQISLWGGGDQTDFSDDYFVVRPSADFPIKVDGGITPDLADRLFLDCANTHATCLPSLIVPGSGTTGASITGFEPVTWDKINATADALPSDLTIKKELVGFAASGAHPGDELEYRVTLKNEGGAPIPYPATPIFVTDVIDYRLSLIEQSILVTAGSVDMTDNRNMLWRIDDVGGSLAVGEEVSMTYTVIVNTLITTVDVPNWASILNSDTAVENQWVAGDVTLEHYAKVDLNVLDVFGFPLKAAINSSLFYETEAGPRYIVGLQGGAKDPSQFGLGAVLCRVPNTNQAVGWDGGLGNLWYSCGTGLPNKGGIPLPLVVTDLFQDSSGRIWLTSWGNEGLFYSDDGAHTWTDAMLDLSGALGGAPDGIPDGFAQVYAITEDILGTLFISANNGDVYRSFDRGSTWQKAKQLPQGSADTAFAMQADPTMPGRLYAGTFGDGLYVTSDFGETWTKPDLTGLGSGYIFDIEFDSYSGNLFVGTAQGIYFSADGGDNWTGLNNAFPVPSHPPEVRNISFDENGALFASTWGQGVWSSLDWQATSLSDFALKTGNVLNVSVSEETMYALLESGSVISFKYEGGQRSTGIEDGDGVEMPSVVTLNQNYPNPFNPATSISFVLPQAANVSLAVYDVIGRKVATLVDGQLASGTHNVSFNAASLPSGMYLYRLSTPNGVMTQKMILLK